MRFPPASGKLHDLFCVLTHVISLALLLIGFSLFNALVLALSHFTGEHYREQGWARGMGLLLLGALAGLQGAHFAWLAHDQAWIEHGLYRVALFSVAPAFYHFAHPLLQPANPPALGNWRVWLHAVPVVAAPWLSPAIALPAAFLLGAGYLVWLARSIYALRATRTGFEREIALLGGVFIIALAVAGLGMLAYQLPEKLFYSLYACAIGLAFLIVQLTLSRRPALSDEISEVARASYAVSTLNQIDCDATLLRLAQWMESERPYLDPELSLSTLAESLQLSAHQLSELLNSRLGKSFSRYLREWRIAEARRLLREEPNASVLSVGLNVGFSSQSGFYDAFREIEGMTPGQYRKLAKA